MDSALILLVEEDPATRAFLAEHLEADGYEVVQAENRRHACVLLASCEPALVLADVNGETVGLLDAIRTGEGLGGRGDRGTPMIVLTSRTDELTRIRVLEHDGDDVVVKPLNYLELRERIRAVLRRCKGPRRREVLHVGTLSVDVASREVHVDGKRVALTNKEFDLLRALAAEPTRVLARRELLRDVWGYETVARTRTLDSHAHRLRRKLTEAGAGQALVINVWGWGYRLVDGELQVAA